MRERIRSTFGGRSAVALFGTAALLSAAAACAPTVAGSGAGDVRSADARRIQGPYAAPGQRFTVQLDQPIDTLESVRRGTFTAHVVTPIVGADGQVIAPAGARVHGIVRSLGSMESPRVRLRFDAIETVHGAAQLPARVRSAQYRTYAGPWMTSYAPAYRPYYGTWGAWGGGPGYYYYDGYWDYVPFRPREVNLPAGARMDLELTRPLVPPGTLAPRR